MPKPNNSTKPDWVIEYEELRKKRREEAMKKKKAHPRYIPYQWWLVKRTRGGGYVGPNYY